MSASFRETVEQRIYKYTILCAELRMQKKRHYLESIGSHWEYYSLKERLKEAETKLRYWEHMRDA